MTHGHELSGGWRGMLEGRGCKTERDKEEKEMGQV